MHVLRQRKFRSIIYYPHSTVSHTPDTCSGFTYQYWEFFQLRSFQFIGSIMLFLVYAFFSLCAATELIASDMNMMCLSPTKDNNSVQTANLQIFHLFWVLFQENQILVPQNKQSFPKRWDAENGIFRLSSVMLSEDTSSLLALLLQNYSYQLFSSSVLHHLMIGIWTTRGLRKYRGTTMEVKKLDVLHFSFWNVRSKLPHL